MKPLIIFILFLSSLNLFANIELKHNYFIKNNYIMLSDIVKDPKEDILLYTFENNKHSKRVKTKELINKLKKYHLADYSLKHSYTQFSQLSPINTDKIRKKIEYLYSSIYKNIFIKNIAIQPRAYLTSIPEEYKIEIPKKYYLSNSGILYIKTVDKKKIFFNYTIEAKVDVFMARNKLNKGDEISNINIKKNSIILDKFKAMPLQVVEKSSLQAKHTINTNQILTKRDVVGLFLIKRGSNVNVMLNESGIDVSILAKANQSGKLGDSIYITTKSGKKIRVIVTGKNIAEVK